MAIYPRTLYFPGDDKRVTVDQPMCGLFIAYLADDVDDEDGHIRVYGKGDGILDAIADLNTELALAEQEEIY